MTGKNLEKGRWGETKIPQGASLAGRELYLADFTCCQSQGLSRNMAEVSVNGNRILVYFIGWQLVDFVYIQWIHNEYTNFGSSPVLSLNSSRARTSISASRLRFLSFEASTLSRSSSLVGILLFISLCIWLFGSKDSAKFPFHQMFGGFSRHFSACKYFKERILLFAVGINIDVGAARFNFHFSIF